MRLKNQKNLAVLSQRSTVSRQLCSVNPQGGFTLLELLIYASLTAMVVGIFSAVLITVTRVQEQQSASTQVTSELNSVVNVIKNRIHGGIDAHKFNEYEIQIINATTTPTIITYDPAAQKLRISEEPVGAFDLTSNRVRVTAMEIVELRSGSSTAIQIAITMMASSTNPRQQATKTLRATAAPLRQAQ